MALLCDIVIAGETARFSEIFARRGLTIDFGGSWALPRRVGLHRAKELTLLADIIDATEADRIGLVNRVVSDDTLDKVVAEMADPPGRRSSDRPRPGQAPAQQRHRHHARAGPRRGGRGADDQLLDQGHRRGGQGVPRQAHADVRGSLNRPGRRRRGAMIAAMAVTTGFNHVAVNTADLDRLKRFYADAFGGSMTFEMERHGGSSPHGDHRSRRRRRPERVRGAGRVDHRRSPPDQGGRGPIDHYALAVDSLPTLEGLRRPAASTPAARSARSNGSATSGRCSSAIPTGWSWRSAAAGTPTTGSPPDCA